MADVSRSNPDEPAPPTPPEGPAAPGAPGPPGAPGAPGAGAPEPGAPDVRPSGAGFLAAMCALVGLGACVVVSIVTIWSPRALVLIFALPAFGVLAVALAATSLSRKTAPDGSRYSRGPAVFGLIVGIACVVLQGAVVIGAMMTYWPIRQNLVPVADTLLPGGAAPAPPGAPIAPLAPEVPPGALEAFLSRCEAAAGPLDRFEVGVDVFFVVRDVTKEAQERGGATGTLPAGLGPKPMFLVGSEGRLLVWVVLDQEALAREEVVIADMLAVLPDGRAATLRGDDGPLEPMRDFLALEEAPAPGAPEPAPGGAPGSTP